MKHRNLDTKVVNIYNENIAKIGLSKKQFNIYSLKALSCMAWWFYKENSYIM